jgi:uncharacterized membrane-anchored protein YitT (DUF2179 family)
MVKNNPFVNILMIILGNILLAIASTYFFIPLQIVNGGMNGIAIVLFSWIGLPIDITTAILAWGFFLLGLILLGKSFSMHTLLATIVYPITMFILLRFVQPNLIGFDPEDGTHFLLASVFGGSLMGIGMALSFLAGGSTGGFDVVMLAGKKFFAIKPSITSLLIDSLIIGAGMFTFGVIAGLYGIISTVITSIMIELIFVGFSRVYLATIVSVKPKEINQFIIEKLERGSTIFPARGGFSQNPIDVIQVAISQQEYFLLKQYISGVDPSAFVVFTQARSIHGLGFDPLYVGIPIRPKKKRIKS